MTWLRFKNDFSFFRWMCFVFFFLILYAISNFLFFVFYIFWKFYKILFYIILFILCYNFSFLSVFIFFCYLIYDRYNYPIYPIFNSTFFIWRRQAFDKEMYFLNKNIKKKKKIKIKFF